MWFETREDPTSMQKSFRKEKSKVSQQEKGEKAGRQGILFRLGEKPPADAEEEVVSPGISVGKRV